MTDGQLSLISYELHGLDETPVRSQPKSRKTNGIPRGRAEDRRNSGESTKQPGGTDLNSTGTGGTTGAEQELPTLARLVANLNGHLDAGTLPDTRTDAFVPHPFLLTPEGVWEGSGRDDKKDPKLVCGPLIVLSLTRGQSDTDFGLVIRAASLTGRVIERTIPSARLHGDPSELARLLEDVGVRIVPGQEKKLALYLDGSRLMAARRRWRTAMPRLGWIDGERLAYMMPDAGLGAADAVYQPERANRVVESAVSQGCLSQWQRDVAGVALQDEITTFALAAACAGALLRPARSDTFGLNFWGTTSRGKTTVLQVAGSVWGRGHDPNSDGRAFCRKWNATGNAIEAIAEEHSDMALPLDELGSFRDAAELGTSIYNLCAGQGKSRLNANAERRAVREWRTVILSSGEISIAELMLQAGHQQRGGQAIRMLDVQMPDEGLFASLGGRAGETVRQLKGACGESYGVAGREFVGWLIERFVTHDALYDRIRARRGEITKALAEGCPPEITRAADRFALVQIAGELATEAGVLPATLAQVSGAIAAVWRRWRSSVPSVDDGARAVVAVAEFIKAHLGRFPDAGDERPPTPSKGLAGYRTSEYFLFNDVGLAEASGGIPTKQALRALNERGLLFKNERDKLKSKHTVRALGRRAAFYAVRDAILEAVPAAPGEAQPEDVL